MREHIIVTTHAKNRIRTRLKSDNALALTYNAIRYGVPRQSVRGPLRKYLDRKWSRYDLTSRILLYMDHIWVFDNNKLITVYPVDHCAVAQLRED